MPAYLMGCVTGEVPGTQGTQIFYTGLKHTCQNFVSEGYLLLMILDSKQTFPLLWRETLSLHSKLFIMQTSLNDSSE